MSVAPVNLLLGSGYLFVKRDDDADGKWRLIGSVKGECAFTYTPEYAEQRPSDVLAAVRRDRVQEEAMMKLTVVDFRMDQLINALGTTISRTQLTATQSIRLVQTLSTPASTTSTRSLSRTAKSTTSIAFTSHDRATDFVKGTDFTVPTTKKYRPLSAAFKNKTVLAFYTKLFSTATRVQIGDKEDLEGVSVMFVHRQSDKKMIAIEFYKATVFGEFSLAFKEKEHTVHELTFKALADTSKAKGNRLFRIARE